MLASEKLLRELVADSRFKVTEEDLKGRSQSMRKLLYKLGAYKDTPMADEDLYIYGIRDTKRMIDRGIKHVRRVNPRVKFETNAMLLYPEARTNIRNILNMDIFDSLWDNNNARYSHYMCHKILAMMRQWEHIKRGKDLFISGLGGFDITAAMKGLKERNHAVYIEVPSPTNLRLIGYFKDQLRETRYGFNEIGKRLQSMKIWHWVHKYKFPLERLDEIHDAKVLGLWRDDLTAVAATNILDDMNVRDLRIEWSDRPDFMYYEGVIAGAKETGWTLPQNGIELKKQAKTFKNCAGSYVRKVSSGETAILYDKNVMVEYNVTNGDVYQALGPRNSSIDAEGHRKVTDFINYMHRVGTLGTKRSIA